MHSTAKFTISCAGFLRVEVSILKKLRVVLQKALEGKQAPLLFSLAIFPLYWRNLGRGIGSKPMYAIIQCGSRQFRVSKGDVIQVDRIDAQPGQEVTLQDVLFVSRGEGQVIVGAPVVSGCVVKAQYLTEVKGPKITSLKYKQRKNQYRKFGHRQRYAQLKILDIQG